MPPEAIETPESVDARSDLYAVGAVGYFLLTGEQVFEGATLMEFCQHHVRTQPTEPSERLGSPVSDDLEALILRCLARKPAVPPIGSQPARRARRLQGRRHMDRRRRPTVVAAARPSAQPENGRVTG